MRSPASTLSPLTIAALLASLAAHAGAAIYMVNHAAVASSVAAVTETATTVDVETIAAPEPSKPEVLPNVVPEVAPPPKDKAAPTVQPTHAEPAPAHPEPTPTSEPTPAAAASPIVGSSEDNSPHFAMVVGNAAVAAGGVTKAAGTASQPVAASSDAPLPASGVDELAHLESGPAPSYPSAAKDEGVEADVPLDIVVDESGRVTEVRATKHLGYGLDESAERAIRGYRFSPAKRGGHPVKIRMRWTVVFRLS